MPHLPHPRSNFLGKVSRGSNRYWVILTLNREYRRLDCNRLGTESRQLKFFDTNVAISGIGTDEDGGILFFVLAWCAIELNEYFTLLLHYPHYYYVKYGKDALKLKDRSEVKV